MSNSSWKREERILAQMFGGKRLPNTGISQPDIRAPGVAVQAKKRKSLPEWLHEAVAQSERDARRGEIPLTVLSEIRQGCRPKRYVVIKLETYLDWYGK